MAPPVPVAYQPAELAIRRQHLRPGQLRVEDQEGIRANHGHENGILELSRPPATAPGTLHQVAGGIEEAEFLTSAVNYQRAAVPGCPACPGSDGRDPLENPRDPGRNPAPALPSTPGTHVPPHLC
jgi:hypothetical protein